MSAPFVRPRELPILAGLARGRSNAEIAADMGLPAGTVIHRIYRMQLRVRAGDRAGLVGLAYREGWLTGLPIEPRPQVRLPYSQLTVLAGMSRGMTNHQLARVKNVGHSTVVRYATRLYQSLGARERAHAVALGYQHGHLPLPAVLPAPVHPTRRAG